jgi:hypothetical protein
MIRHGTPSAGRRGDRALARDVAGLCADGCDAIVFACAGGFSAMDGDEGIQKPMHDALMPPAIVATGRVLCEKPD